MRTSAGQLFTLFVAGAALAGCSDSTPPVPTGPGVASSARNPRSTGFIVIMKKGANLSRIRPGARLSNVIGLRNTAAAATAVITAVVPSVGGVVVAGASSAAALEADDVQAVIPNYEADLIDPLQVPFDAVSLAGPNPTPAGSDQSSAFFFANNTQWGYKKISANRAWVPSRGGAGAKVCITDSGIDAGHVAFATKSILSTSFIANSAAQTDTNGHGSHVAGTVSTNGQGGASVAPDAALMTAKVFNGAGGGAATSVVLNAVKWCTDNGADVINMSLGFTGGVPISGNEAFIAAYEAGLDYATSRGVLIVSSAGNDGVAMPAPGLIFLPAEAPGVTSVAATGPSTNLTPFGANPTWQAPGAAFEGIASYSNRGPVPSVDLSAPGGDLLAGWPSQSLIMSVCSRQFRSGVSFPCAANGFFLFNGGTSMASPHVAGVAALIRARWPSTMRSAAFRQKIENCLYRSVDNIGPTSVFGRGRVNAFKAVTQPC